MDGCDLKKLENPEKLEKDYKKISLSFTSYPKTSFQTWAGRLWPVTICMLVLIGVNYYFPGRQIVREISFNILSIISVVMEVLISVYCFTS